MNDLNRLRALSGLPLVESISGNPAINVEIERQLARHTPAEQTRMLDALELLKNAGPDGLSVAEWYGQLQAMYPEDGDSLRHVLAFCAKECKVCIQRVGEKRYGWVETPRQENPMDDVMQGIAASQIQLTHLAIGKMEEMGTFSREQLASMLAQNGTPPSRALDFADHLLSMAGVERIGPNRYRMGSERPHTNDDSMNLLRDIANKASGRDA